MWVVFSKTNSGYKIYLAIFLKKYQMSKPKGKKKWWGGKKKSTREKKQLCFSLTPKFNQALTKFIVYVVSSKWKKSQDKEGKADEKPLRDGVGLGRKERKGEDFFEAEFELQPLFVAYPPRLFSMQCCPLHVVHMCCPLHFQTATKE